jgi:ribonuclease HII
MTPAAREEQAERIKEKAEWCVEVVHVDEIDRINILWASMLGIARALERLNAARALIDGNCLPKTQVPVEAVVGGDGKYACIAAASILAKTTRDAMMRELACQYPEYGFDSHFGYSTPEHLAALAKHGPCPLHRRSFTRISELINQPCLTFDE